MPSVNNPISDLVGAGKLGEALETAKQWALSGLTDLDTPVTLLSSEYEYLKRSAINGLLSAAEELTGRQKIAFRLLTLVENISGPGAPAASGQAAKDVILFLGANPFKNLALELEREVTEVSEGLNRFGKRDAFDFRAKIHITPTDLQRMLLEVATLRPRFVHFSGNAVVNHPSLGSGVIFEDEKGDPRTVSGEVLAMIFKQFPGVECVFLNTCDSGPSAQAIGRYVRYTIGMNARIFDESAIIFAVAFYEAIAGGNDVPFAYDFARTRLMMERYPEQASIPVLITDGQCPDPVYVSGDSHLEEEHPRPRIMR